jgi:hypothetical protein
VGYDLPLFEFACHLASIVAGDGLPIAPEGTEIAYFMFDEAFSLHCCKADGAIWIRSNLGEDQGWVIPLPEADFYTGGREFLRGFVTELSGRIPGILDDVVGDALRPYVTE